MARYVMDSLHHYTAKEKIMFVDWLPLIALAVITLLLLLLYGRLNDMYLVLQRIAATLEAQNKPYTEKKP
jgi:hypothetical protein